MAREGAGTVSGGVIGCGHVARTRHLPALAGLPEAALVAVTDVDRAAADAAAHEWGLPRSHGSVAELVADETVQAVAVCVPAAHHVEVALAAVEAGKHVLIEKPLALSLTEADRLVERSRASEVKVMVAFNMRWHRLVRRARVKLRRGELGRLRSIRTVLGSQPAGSRPGAPPWLESRTLGGGSLVEQAIHHFDLWRLLAGDEVDDVVALSAPGPRDDAAVTVSARMRGGALAAGLAAHGTTTANRVELYGDRGTLELCLYRLDGMAHSTPSDLPGAPRTRLKRALETVRELGAGLPALRGGGDFDATYPAEWRHFIAAINTGEEPECGLHDGRRALAVALAAAHSASTGERVRVDDAPAELTPVSRDRP